MFNYYVQEIANNYIKNLVSPPTKINVHKNFLHGAEVGEFSEGFRELVNIMKQIYSDIMNKPDELDMPLKEISISNAKNKDYTDSNAGLLRYPHTLLILGYRGTLQPDMTLNISGGDILEAAKELKITKIQNLLSNLTKYGFVITGVSKKIFIGDNIIVSYPENRYLLAALKSMCDATIMILNGDIKKSKNIFYMLNYVILENENPKLPKMNIDYIYHVLDIEKRAIAKQFNDYIVQYSKPSIKMGGIMRNDWSSVYSLFNNKRVILSIKLEQDNLSVKLNLANINRYITYLNEYPSEIKNTIKSSGWDCAGHHGKCEGGFAFELDGAKYYKCRCGSFIFENISKSLVQPCIELLEKEINIQCES